MNEKSLVTTGGRNPFSGERHAESFLVQCVKVLLYIAAFTSIQLWRPLTTEVGYGAFIVAVLLGSFLAQRAVSAEMRTLAAVVLGAIFATLFHFASRLILTSETIAPALGVDGAVYTSDILSFGLSVTAIVFTLRVLAKRHRVVAILELTLVVFLASYALFEHRGLQINRPYWFADTLFSLGLDPVDFLKALGVGLMVLGLIMALQRPGTGKGWMSFVLAALVALLVFFYLRDRAAPAVAAAPTANLMGGEDPADADEDENEDKDGNGKPDKDEDKDGDGKPDGKNGGGGGGGSGKNNSPFGKNNKRPPPNPVALATFHDDFEPKDPVLYFRQNAESKFDQTHLTPDTSGQFDTDLITKFPTNGPIDAPKREDAYFKKVPTSMFLISDHPEPVALSHASELRPLDNPNPNLFVAAYEATSESLDTDWSRLVGRKSIPDSWDEARRKHYTDYPDDPRYRALSDEITRDLDPRYQDDDLVKAFAIKRYLEKNGFYTLKETHKDATDPTASFLFGSLRGYCVHFAHSAVFLMRSQGIAARVAVGYAVDTARRGSGSSLLILGNMAHAWPEIHLDGVGWVTFDVYPEQSDQPPEEVVDQDLASMLGEIARNDPSGGMAANPNREPFPWPAILWTLAGLLGLTVLSAYGVKLTRYLLPGFASPSSAHRWALRSALDSLAGLGFRREPGETREHFADRLGQVAPSLRPLTMTHLRSALGPPGQDSATPARRELAAVRAELRRSLPLWKRLLSILNPVGWWLTR